MTQKDKTQIAITAALVVVLTAAVLRAQKRMGREVQSVSPATSTLVANNDTTAGGQRVAELRKEAAQLPLGRDPFVPVPEKLQPTGPVFELMGIVEERGVMTAFINDDIVEVGSVVNDLTVQSITKDKVILSDGTKTLELTIGSEGP